MRHTVVRGTTPNHPYRKRPNVAMPPVHNDDPVTAVVLGTDLVPEIAPEPTFDSVLAPTPEQHTGPAMEDWAVDPTVEPEPEPDVTPAPKVKPQTKSTAPAKAKGGKKK